MNTYRKDSSSCRVAAPWAGFLARAGMAKGNQLSYTLACIPSASESLSHAPECPLPVGVDLSIEMAEMAM